MKRQYITRDEFRQMLGNLKEIYEQKCKSNETYRVSARSYDAGEESGMKHMIDLIEAFSIGMYNYKGVDI